MKHLLIVLLIALCQTLSAGKKAPTPLTAQGEKLLAEYTQMLGTLRKEVTAAASAIDEKKKAAFVEGHGKIAKLPKLPNPTGRKMAPVTHAPSNPAYAEAQGKALTLAKDVLKQAEPFLKSDKLHARLAKIALLTDGARQMAVFAQSSPEQKSYVDLLLGDDKLIVEVMELGGAYEGKYGEAIRNYKAIQKASKNAAGDKGFYRIWALASSLEHPDGCYVPEGKTPAQAMVEFYLNYEKAYLAGELDPAFPKLPNWEYRFIFPGRSVEDVTWMRAMMRNYRPDHITMKDYKWRYCRITKSDVPYTGGVKRPVRPDLNLTSMQDFFLEGGICGPRAFTGRLATHAFGIPSRKAPQTGHAAMSHWTPDGWTVVFGAHWTFNHCRGQCGLDFELESRARKVLDEYKQVHRANWLGDAFGEGGVQRRTFGVGGGFWKSLAFYKKLAIVEAADLKEQELTGSELAESNEAAVSDNSDWDPEKSPKPKGPEIPQVELTDADKKIVYGDDGVITIPVGSCSKPVSTEKIRFMKAIDGKGVHVHYNLAGKRPELLKYTINAPAAGKYAFSARVVTVTVDRNFILRLNRRTLVTVDLPYTKGFWKETKPVDIDLKQGRNTIMLTLRTPNKGVTFGGFKLTPVK